MGPLGSKYKTEWGHLVSAMKPLGSKYKTIWGHLVQLKRFLLLFCSPFAICSTFHMVASFSNRLFICDQDWVPSSKTKTRIGWIPRWDTKVGFQVPKPSLQAFSSYLPPAFLLKSTSMHKLQNSETRISFWILVYWQKDLLEKLDSLCWLSLRTSQKRFLHFAAGLPALTSPSKTPISPCPSDAHEKQTRRLKPRQ